MTADKQRTEVPSERKKSPAYLTLYHQIRDEIVHGRYPCGMRLRSKRFLAEETGVSVITVEHAYALLAEEGYIEPRERSGYYVIFKSEDGFAGTGESVMPQRLPAPFAQRENEALPLQFPFSVIARTMRGVLTDYGEKLFERSPNEGTPELRTEISLYLARSRGIEVPPERIVIGAGAEYLYNQILGLLGRERIYGIESPSYRIIESVYRISGVEYEMLPLGTDGIESAALKESRAEVLHLTPYRSFPSGVSASASKRHEYLHWAKREGRYLVEDDYESEFSVLKKPEDTLFSQSDGDNVIYLNTFSKSISPSLRVGYMLLPQHLLPVFREKLGFFSCTVSTPIQIVLAELLRKGDFERHINRVRRAKRRGQMKRQKPAENDQEFSTQTCAGKLMRCE